MWEAELGVAFQALHNYHESMSRKVTRTWAGMARRCAGAGATSLDILSEFPTPARWPASSYSAFSSASATAILQTSLAIA